MDATRLRRSASLLLALLAACAGPVDAPPLTLEEKVAAIDALLADGGAPGYGIAVAQDGQEVRVAGYGLADVEAQRAVTPDTVFQIGSLTKQFTAAAVLGLVEEGVVGLQDPITRWLPEAPAAWESITVHHLLAHRSGLADYQPVDPDAPISGADFLSGLARMPRISAPGVRWAYNNANYFLLGLLLEHATGKAYGELLEERFFAPLGMASTGVCGTEPSSTPVPSGYSALVPGAAPRPEPPMQMTHAFSASALCSTALDLLRWQQALTEGRVLRPETYALMASAWSTDVPTAWQGYGYGLIVTPAGGKGGTTKVWHGGWMPGFHVVLAHYPEHRLHVAVLANITVLGSMEPEALEQSIAEVMLGP